jgi:16S rRNA (cytidine1402-2'-O)-methyltransferase
MSKSDRSASFLVGQQEIPARPLPAGLYVVATPIGNLGDISLRALETLAGADVIACEDTRVTHKLLDRYGIKASLAPYHEHNAASARPRLLERIAAGAAVALVSDAGTPLISDPGYKLVREARDAGHAVTAIPGASSVMAALAGAGLPTDRFFFEGFLPAKTTARRARIAELARMPATLVLFESGPRVAATLADLADVIGAREAAICRELTKLHEEVRRESLSALADGVRRAPVKGELVLVIEGAVEAEPDLDAALDETLARVAGGDSVREATRAVAQERGVPRRALYDRVLEHRRTAGHDSGADG